jgi:hypothetical protein
MKKLWALRYVLGILLTFGLVVALLGAAVMRFPVYVGIAVLLLVGWIIAIQPRIRREREREKKSIDEAFRAAYAQLSHSPSIVVSSSYGYPAFEIKFRSKPEMEAAAVQNEIFKREIDRIFEGYGPRSRPFSAEMAIFFTYEGHLDELRALFKTA